MSLFMCSPDQSHENSSIKFFISYQYFLITANKLKKISVNEKIFVECKMWSENVVDSVEFELMIESL